MAAAALPADALFALLVQLFAILAVARALGALAGRGGLPPVVGELLTGLVLGPTLLGALWPAGFAALFPGGVGATPGLDAVAWLGLLLLLALTGLETDLDLLRRRARPVAVVSTASVALPFALGFAFAYALPASLTGPAPRSVFALFLATALSISAIPVIARTLVDLGALDSEVGQVALAAALANDTVGWLLLSVVAGIARTGSVAAGSAARTVGLLVAVIAVALSAGRRVVDALLARVGGGRGEVSVLVTLALGASALTHALGLEAFLGALVVGVLVGRSGRLDESSREGFEAVTLGALAPVFFGVAGLRADLGALADPGVALAAAATLAVATVGKVVGAAGGAALAGYGRWEALALGAALNARGAMEIIVAAVGLSLGVLTPEMYAVVVLLAVATSVVAAPLLRWSLARADAAANGR